MLIKNSVKKNVNHLCTAIVKGFLIAILATLVGALVCAALITSEIVSEIAIGKCAIAIQLVSTFLGAVALNRKEMRVIVEMLIGVSYVSVLFATTALVFGGQYNSVGTSMIAVVIGCILGMIVNKGLNSGGKIRRHKIRRR